MRVVAGLTAAYSVAVTIRPRVLAKPCGLLDVAGNVLGDGAGLIRSTGTRDAALLLALAAVPVGRLLHIPTAARMVW